MNKYHYVYRITNTKLNKHYYGVRTSKIEPSKDLGVKYFSSSSDIEFRNDQKNNPQDYKYVIVSILNSREEAAELEIILHLKFKVDVNESFYNRAKALHGGFQAEMTDEVREKIRKVHIGNKYAKGKKLSQEHKDNIKKGMIGTVIMPEWYVEHSRKLMKAYEWYYNPLNGDATRLDPNGIIPEGWIKGMGPKNKSQCPHCDLIGVNKAVMSRWHFDNCKKKQ